MLDYPALVAMAAVVREGSFERAAERLGVTPSAISQRVKALEERLGTILIVRGQPCMATSLGRKLCAHVDQVQLLETDLALSLHGSETPITLRVAVNSDSMASWFPEAAADFARNSSCMLEFVLEDEAHTADRLRSGEVVAAISADPSAVQGCRTIELGAIDYLACASPAFIAHHFPDGVTEKALNQAPCLRFDRRDGLQARWARERHAIDLDPPTHWVPSTSGFLHFAVEGMAWGMQPVVLARDPIDRGQLAELSPNTPIRVALYWTVARLQASALKTLTDAVRRVARSRLIQPD